MSSAIRSIVSKKKKRFTDDGFDLDLTYITPRIIAMGFPSEGAEAAYRNPMPEVQRFFETRHAGHFRLYNLCSERAYDAAKFGGHDFARRFPFDDHNPAPLPLVMACLEDMHAFYNADERNVVAVHCKAGKGRTGLIISAFLVRQGIAKTASDAIKIFGTQRTSNAHGLTIPSQMRYVHYVDAALRQGGAAGAGGALPAAKTYKVRHVRFITVPNFDLGGGCDPYFDVRIAVPKARDAPEKGFEMRKVFDLKKALGGKVENYQPRHKFVDLDVRDHNLLIAGDVKFVFYDYDRFSADDKVCHFWINTGFIQKNYLLLYKPVIDRACKDKEATEFDPTFAIELFFEPSAETIDFAALGEAVDDDKDDPPGEGDEEAEALAAAADAEAAGAAGAAGGAAAGGGARP